MTRHPVLRPGDRLRLDGETQTVAGLDSTTVRLADVTGAVREVPTARLLADPSLELVTPSRVPMAPQPALERLPTETVEHARWWERHLIEVITGCRRTARQALAPARPTTRPGGRCASGSWPSTRTWSWRGTGSG
jgi:putative transposase